MRSVHASFAWVFALSVAGGGCHAHRPIRVGTPDFAAVMHGIEADEPLGLGPADMAAALSRALVATRVFETNDSANALAEVQGAIQVDSVTREIEGAVSVRVRPRGGGASAEEALPLSATVAASANSVQGEEPVSGARR